MKPIGLALLLLMMRAPHGSAQEQAKRYEIHTLRFDGNTIISSGVLRSVVVTRQTPGLFWRILYKVSEKLGEKPEYYDPVVFSGDLLRLRKWYRDQGFFHSLVDSAIVYNDEDETVDLTFRIEEGKRSLIDTLQYRGITGAPPVVLEQIRESPVVKTGDPYVVDRVEAELRRVVSIFLNNGFSAISVDPVIVRRYASTNNVAVSFVLSPGKRYRFGAITVAQDSTLGHMISPTVVFEHLDYREGDFFSEQKKIESEQNLNRLAVVEASRIEPQTPVSTDGSFVIPTRVNIRTRPFHELSPEIGANDEDKTFNILFGLGYSNRNFFGGARNFSIKSRMSLQAIQDVDLVRVFKQTGIRDSTLIAKFELTNQLVQPYFFTNKVNMTVSVGYIVEKQKLYLADILRGKVGVGAQLARYTRGSVEWNLERIKPEGINIPLELLLQIRNDLQPQFNSIITFSLSRDKRDDLFNPTQGFYHLGSVEEAGLLPKMLGGLTKTLPYSRYVKIWGVGQWYWNPDDVGDLIWAFRATGGFAQLYGGSTTPVPLTRRFYAGGGGSVRGWKSRSLGAVVDASQGGNALFEANLEARWNLFRTAGRLWFIDLSNISLVGFYDMGDVWTELKRMRITEIAMATGLGLRWNTIAGPIRVDFAVRVYDPFAPPGRQWITKHRLFHDTYGLIQFGIGQAF